MAIIECPNCRGQISDRQENVFIEEQCLFPKKRGFAQKVVWNWKVDHSGMENVIW